MFVFFFFFPELLDIPELADNSDQDIPQYEWKVDTKYYTAQVGLCAVSDPDVNLCRESPESIQSVVLYFDAEEVRLTNQSFLTLLLGNILDNEI